MNDEYRTGFQIYKPPPAQARLHVAEGFTIDLTHPVPSRWVQFWHKWFFGFRWEKV